MNPQTAKNTQFRTVTILDGLIICMCLAGAIAFFPFMRSNAPATAVVYRDNARIAEYPLSETKEFSIAGAQGQMALDIDKGGIRVYAAHCPNQICVHTGFIKQPGQQIICVPNHVIVEIHSVSQKDDAVDAIVQ
jgi:hypothetical protein